MKKLAMVVVLLFSCSLMGCAGGVNQKQLTGAGLGAALGAAGAYALGGGYTKGGVLLGAGLGAAAGAAMATDTEE
jgi:hypothetical protein